MQQSRNIPVFYIPPTVVNKVAASFTKLEQFCFPIDFSPTKKSYNGKRRRQLVGEK